MREAESDWTDPPPGYPTLGNVMPPIADPKRFTSRNGPRMFSDGHFEELSAFKSHMARAEDRCRQIAMSERMLGFEDSWRAYTDLGNDIANLYHWVEIMLP